MDLDAAFEFSRYASRLRTAQPELAARVLTAIDRPARVDAGDLETLGATPDAAALAAAVRTLRARVGLATLLRDLTGRADLTEVCTTQTRLAELAIGAAVDAVVAVATAAPTTASASVARLILLDVSTGVPSSSSRCAAGAATHDVATLNLISLKGRAH